MSSTSLLNDGFKYQNLLNQTSSGNLNTFQLSTGAETGYILASDSLGNGSWVDIGTLGVSSITGTANQVLANGTSGSPQTGDITLTLPQDINIMSNVQFGSIDVDSATIGTLSGVLKATAGLVSGSATTTDLPEGTNLYFTDARFDTRFDTDFALKSTTDLKEGTNLYYTTARARSALSGTNGVSYNSSTGIIQLDGSYTPTFANIIDSGLTANRLVYSDTSKQLSSANLLGTTNQVTVSGLGTSTITLSLPQDIATTSSPLFATEFIRSTTADSYFEIRNQLSGFNNFFVYKKDRTGGLNTNEVIGQEIKYGTNSSNAAYTAMLCYTRNDSSTAGAEQASTIWQSMAAGSLTQVFGFVGSDVFLSNRTSNALTYVDSSKYIKSVTLGSSLSFSAPTLDTIQPITTSSIPTFAGLYALSSGSISDTALPVQLNTPATSERYYAVNKNGSYGALIGYVNGAGLGTGLIIRNVPADPIYIYVSNVIKAAEWDSSGNFNIQTKNLYLKAGDTNQYVKYQSSFDGVEIGSWQGVSFKTLSTGSQEVMRINTTSANLPLQTASTYAYIDSSKNLVSRSSANFTSDVVSSITGSNLSIANLTLTGTAGTADIKCTGTTQRQYMNTSTLAYTIDGSGNINIESHGLYVKSSDLTKGFAYNASISNDCVGIFGSGSNICAFTSGATTVARVTSANIQVPLETASTYAYIDSSKNIVSRSSANFTSDVRSQISATSPISYNSSTGVISSSLPSTVTSGTYTPTITNVANLSNFASQTGCYSRVGNTVTFGASFVADIAAKAAGVYFQWYVSIPVNNSGAWPSAIVAYGYTSAESPTSTIIQTESQSSSYSSGTNTILCSVCFPVNNIASSGGFKAYMQFTYNVT